MKVGAVAAAFDEYVIVCFRWRVAPPGGCLGHRRLRAIVGSLAGLGHFVLDGSGRGTPSGLPLLHQGLRHAQPTQAARTGESPRVSGGFFELLPMRNAYLCVECWSPKGEQVQITEGSLS